MRTTTVHCPPRREGEVYEGFVFAGEEAFRSAWILSDGSNMFDMDEYRSAESDNGHGAQKTRV